MNTPEENAAWIREVRRRAGWIGFLVGFSLATIIFFAIH